MQNQRRRNTSIRHKGMRRLLARNDLSENIRLYEAHIFEEYEILKEEVLME